MLQNCWEHTKILPLDVYHHVLHYSGYRRLVYRSNRLIVEVLRFQAPEGPVQQILSYNTDIERPLGESVLACRHTGR